MYFVKSNWKVDNELRYSILLTSFSKEELLNTILG